MRAVVQQPMTEQSKRLILEQPGKLGIETCARHFARRNIVGRERTSRGNGVLCMGFSHW